MTSRTSRATNVSNVEVVKKRQARQGRQGRQARQARQGRQGFKISWRLRDAIYFCFGIREGFLLAKLPRLFQKPTNQRQHRISNLEICFCGFFW